MTTPDIIILLVLLISVVIGLFKGFISQAIAVISVFAGAWLSFHFSRTLCDWAAQYLTGVSEQLMNIIAFAIIFIFAVAILGLVGRLIKKIIRIAFLGWLDRLLGMMLALAVGLMVTGLCVVLFDSINNMLQLVKPEILSESTLYGPVKDFAYNIFPYLKALIYKL